MQAWLLNLRTCRPGIKKPLASCDTGAWKVSPSEKGQNTKRGQASGLQGGGQLVSRLGRAQVWWSGQLERSFILSHPMQS